MADSSSPVIEDVQLRRRKVSWLVVSLSATLGLAAFICAVLAEVAAPTKEEVAEDPGQEEAHGPSWRLGVAAIFLTLPAAVVPTITFCGAVCAGAGRRSKTEIVLFVATWAMFFAAEVMLMKAVTDESKENKRLPDGTLQDVDPLKGVFAAGGVGSLLASMLGIATYFVGRRQAV